MEDAVEEYSLTGFDAEGEPHVGRTATGRLWLCIQLMPPSWAEDDGTWDDFDQRLAAAIGAPVVWEDREWFRIDHPRPDTISAIQQFLASVKKQSNHDGPC